MLNAYGKQPNKYSKKSQEKSFLDKNGIKLVFIILSLSLFMNLFLIYGTAFFVLVRREAVEAAAAFISLSLAISSIG